MRSQLKWKTYKMYYTTGCWNDEEKQTIMQCKKDNNNINKNENYVLAFYYVFSSFFICVLGRCNSSIYVVLRDCDCIPWLNKIYSGKSRDRDENETEPFFFIGLYSNSFTFAIFSNSREEMTPNEWFLLMKKEAHRRIQINWNSI